MSVPGMSPGMVAGSALQGGGMALGAVGSIMAGRAQAQAYEASADQAYLQGEESMEMARYETRLIRRAGTAAAGQTRAEAGKASVAMSGTPLATLVETARQTELAAQLRARSGRIEKTRYTAQGKALEAAAKEAKRQGLFGAIGSFL